MLGSFDNVRVFAVALSHAGTVRGLVVPGIAIVAVFFLRSGAQGLIVSSQATKNSKIGIEKLKK